MNETSPKSTRQWNQLKNWSFWRDNSLLLKFSCFVQFTDTFIQIICIPTKFQYYWSIFVIQIEWTEHNKLSIVLFGENSHFWILSNNPAFKLNKSYLKQMYFISSNELCMYMYTVCTAHCMHKVYRDIQKNIKKSHLWQYIKFEYKTKHFSRNTCPLATLWPFVRFLRTYFSSSNILTRFS